MTPRKYVISPTRNRMAKAVARKNRMTVAKEVLTDPVTKKHVVVMLGKELASEVRSMASDGANSILQSLNTRHLKEFSWNLLMDELSKFASTDCSIVGLCASILINHQNQKMNLVQKINSLILYAGHTSKEVNLFHSTEQLLKFPYL